MRRIEETNRGCAVRHDLVTIAGCHIGVISYQSGDRDLLIYDRDDPDRCAQTIRLGEEDSRALTCSMRRNLPPTARPTLAMSAG
jgi:TrkA domain protein